MNIVVVNSGVGNVTSVVNMLKRLRVDASIEEDAGALSRADALILPGVGSFDAAMKRFRGNGVADALERKVREGATPILGICLGMQVMGTRSEEGKESGFGWIAGELKRFRPEDGGATPVKVPHMGWNIVVPKAGDPLYAGFDASPRFYFDHSYHFVPADESSLVARSCHGLAFAAGIRRGLLFGVQFHPEKSHRFGLQLLRNFVNFCSQVSQASELIS